MRRRIAQSLTGLVLALLAVFTIAGQAFAGFSFTVTANPPVGQPYPVGTILTITVTQTPDSTVGGTTTFKAFQIQGSCFGTLNVPGDVYTNGQAERVLVFNVPVNASVPGCVPTFVEGNIVTPDPSPLVSDVTIAPGNLPRTGSDTWREVWLGGLLGMAGVALVIVARRRARLYGID